MMVYAYGSVLCTTIKMLCNVSTNVAQFFGVIFDMNWFADSGDPQFWKDVRPATSEASAVSVLKICMDADDSPSSTYVVGLTSSKRERDAELVVILIKKDIMVAGFHQKSYLFQVLLDMQRHSTHPQLNLVYSTSNQKLKLKPWWCEITWRS